MTTGLALLSIVCGAVVALGGLGIAASGNGLPVLSWLIFAIGLLNVAIGIVNYVIAR